MLNKCIPFAAFVAAPSAAAPSIATPHTMYTLGTYVITDSYEIIHNTYKQAHFLYDGRGYCRWPIVGQTRMETTFQSS